MSRYSVNEEELRKGQQLLLHVGNKLEAAARNVENAKESLMGYTGYGIERQRYTLETQKNVLALQMENVERLRACIQQVMERTQVANQEARAELQNSELNTGFKTAADIVAAAQAKREAEERKKREEEERKKAQEQAAANRNPGNAGGSPGRLVTNYGGNNYRTTTNYQQYLMDQHDYKRFGEGDYNGGCTAVAWSMAVSSIKGEWMNPEDNWTDGVGITSWHPLKIYPGPQYSFQKKLQIAYQELQQGRPTAIRVATDNYFDGGHSVTIVGVRDGASFENLKMSDFLIADPGTGQIALLSKYRPTDKGSIFALGDY